MELHQTDLVRKIEVLALVLRQDRDAVVSKAIDDYIERLPRETRDVIHSVINLPHDGPPPSANTPTEQGPAQRVREYLLPALSQLQPGEEVSFSIGELATALDLKGRMPLIDSAMSNRVLRERHAVEIERSIPETRMSTVFKYRKR